MNARTCMPHKWYVLSHRVLQRLRYGMCDNAVDKNAELREYGLFLSDHGRQARYRPGFIHIMHEL